MDQFEFTKIAGAILLALLLIFGVRTIVDARLPGPPAHPGAKPKVSGKRGESPPFPDGRLLAGHSRPDHYNR